VAGRTQQIGYGTWYSSSRQPGTREASGRTQIVVAQDEMFDAAAVGDTVTATASLPLSGTATGTAAAAGGTLTTTTLLVDGAAVGLGPLTARQYMIGGLLPLFVEESDDQREFVVGATFLSETLTGAAVDATASGDTVAATSATVAGSAVGAAAISGQTLSTTAAIIAGTATATATGAATGAIVPASVSALSGTATGAANQAGDTATATATLITGTAGAVATAAGAMQTATASLSVSGAAIGSAAATGSTLTATTSLVDGAAVGGRPLTARQYMIGGLLPLFVEESSTGREFIVGATFVAETLTEAAVDAAAVGATIAATASLVPGAATGESVIAIIGGGGQRMRVEPQDAVARGALIVCRARLIAGHASTLSLFPGMAHGSADAANDNLPPVLVSLIAGEAQGQRSYSDSELLMIFAEAA
jgi:hypothetical protein